MADLTVEGMYNALKAKEAKIASAEKKSYITSGEFRFSATNGPIIDIKTCTNKKTLIDILAFLKGRDTNQAEAAKELGEAHEPTWMGATTEQWKHDLVVRITTLNLVKLKQEVLEDKALLLELDPDFDKKLKLEAIAARLS